MKPIAVLLTIFIATGCTTVELEHYSTNQVASLSDQRYQEVLDNLAVLAHNTGVLPSFSLMDNGIVNVQDSASVDPKTIWNLTGFFQQSLTIFGKHGPDLTWTFDPVVEETQLTAMRYACLWAVCGPLPPGSDGYEFLRAPSYNDVFPAPGTPASGPKSHFDVVWRLNELHPGWLHCGRHRDVDSCACYKSRCGDTFVWVNADGLKALSDFTLVVLDIATTLQPTVIAKTPLASVDVNGNSTACANQCTGPDCTMPPQYNPAHSVSDTTTPALTVTEGWAIVPNPLCTLGNRPQYMAMTQGYVVQLPDVCNARRPPTQTIVKTVTRQIIDPRTGRSHPVSETLQFEQDTTISQPVLPIIPADRRPQ